MLNGKKLKKLCKERKITAEQLADHLARGGFDKKQALSAVKNWQHGLDKPAAKVEDVRRLATAVGVEANDLTRWHASYRWAPISAKKAMLISQLISGRDVQDAMDILKFTHKRAATMMDKVLRSAVANADEQEADVESLYVSETKVDDAGVRVGTKRWIAKDRGRAHRIRQRASHIHVTIEQL